MVNEYFTFLYRKNKNNYINYPACDADNNSQPESFRNKSQNYIMFSCIRPERQKSVTCPSDE